MTNTEEPKNHLDLEPVIKDMLSDCEVFESEQEVVNHLMRRAKLLAPSSRAFIEGGTPTEILTRLAEYVERDAVVAHEAGKERGQAWASEQQSWDPKWVSLDIHSSEAVCVEVDTCDLAYSVRDREYGAYTQEYLNAFMEGAQEHFRQQGS